MGVTHSPRRSRRLLILGLNYRPEEIGIGPYTAGLAEELVRRGHRVDVIAGQPYYPQWRALEGYSGWTTREENGVRVHRCPHYVPSDPTGARRIAHHASFAASTLLCAVRAAKRLAPDCVLAVAPSLLAVPVAARAAKAAGAPLWLHVQDFEVEAAIATGLIGGVGSAARAARRFESAMLARADRISTISPQMCALLQDRGIVPERIVELRNWANHAGAVEAAAGARLRREWGLEDKTVALYSGNIANKQGLEIAIEAARLLASRDDLAFLICGNGPNRRRLEAMAHGLSNVRFEDLQPASRVGELLAMADVHLLPQLAGAADLVLPSKLGNMLASGRPVVATAEAGTGLAQEVEGCGLTVPPGDAQAFAGAIAQLADDPGLRARLGEAGQARARERWTLDGVADRFEAALEKLLAGPR